MQLHQQRVKRLRDAGYKVTNARLTVLKVLEEQEGHMTSTEVLEAVNAMDPNVGRASVFRTLDLFTELALIRPTYIGGSTSPTYVLMPDGHHHHIVCSECHRVIEFEDCGLTELEQRLEHRYNVELFGHLLEFYGLCESCKVESADSTA
jgi:Fur family ferric uptake transcriptional regulator